MRVLWFKENGVEGQAFLPEQATQETILFCPGFPGMGATIFEQRHAAALVEEGYAVYVIKHKGIRIASSFAPVMINNAARLQDAYTNAEKYLGGESATIEDWLMEPFHMLPLLHAKYDKIHVIGNSFGAISSLWSLTHSAAQKENVYSILLYAGAQGVDDGSEDCIMRIWKPEYMMAERITDKVCLNDPFDMANTLQKTYRELPSRVITLPDKISMTYLVVERDEFLNIGDTKAFQEAIGGRGKIVMDSVDHPRRDIGLLAHDTPDFRTADLLKILKG